MPHNPNLLAGPCHSGSDLSPDFGSGLFLRLAYKLRSTLSATPMSRSLSTDAIKMAAIIHSFTVRHVISGCLYGIPQMGLEMGAT